MIRVKSEWKSDQIIWENVPISEKGENWRGKGGKGKKTEGEKRKERETRITGGHFSRRTRVHLNLPRPDPSVIYARHVPAGSYHITARFQLWWRGNWLDTEAYVTYPTSLVKCVFNSQCFIKWNLWRRRTQILFGVGTFHRKTFHR